MNVIFRVLFFNPGSSVDVMSPARFAIMQETFLNVITAENLTLFA